MRKAYDKILAGIVSLLFLIMFSVSLNISASSEFAPPEGNFIVSSKKTTLVPGVVETEVIYNTADGQNPVSGFIVDINLGSSVNIVATLSA